MAIVLEANYSKKIGLAGYSSHQFSITLKSEITDITQIQAESARMYQQLQQSVDSSLKEIGWLPETNGHHTNGHTRDGNPAKDIWKCSPKQKDLIIKIVEENQLNKDEVEKLAIDRFSKGVKELNKLEASGLIEELFEKYPRKNGRQTVPAR